MSGYVMYGFDTAGALAEETREPRRRVPRAILQALTAAAGLGALLILTALLAATRWVTGEFSGSLAERLGYANYFLVTFFLGLPAFLLIPRLRRASRAA